MRGWNRVRYRDLQPPDGAAFVPTCREIDKLQRLIRLSPSPPLSAERLIKRGGRHGLSFGPTLWSESFPELNLTKNLTSYTGAVRQLLFCFGHGELLERGLFPGVGELCEVCCGCRGSCVWSLMIFLKWQHSIWPQLRLRPKETCCWGVTMSCLWNCTDWPCAGLPSIDTAAERAQTLVSSPAELYANTRTAEIHMCLLLFLSAELQARTRRGHL